MLSCPQMDSVIVNSMAFFFFLRSMQIVPLDKQITIIDSPCLIISPCNSPTALALRSPASIEELRPLEAASAILSQADNEQVKELLFICID
jgi:hypothetical protein